jgi:hypothetical protein
LAVRHCTKIQGYSNDKVDAAILALSGAKLSDAQVFANKLIVEKKFMAMLPR